MSLRFITGAEIADKLYAAIGEITFQPDPALPESLDIAQSKETLELPRDILSTLKLNLEIAKSDRIPICQDTGLLVVFAELGNELVIEGPPLPDIINNTLSIASKDFYLRASTVSDPLFWRINSGSNLPAMVHVRIVKGDKLTLKIAQKGGGAENMSRICMFNPSSTEQDIINFVLETVHIAGGKACPPLVLGIGIGGDFEMCAVMAKEALLQPLNTHNTTQEYASMEAKILTAVNNTGIGAQGMGGVSTALAVHILTAPCHIASMPVAVNVQCHAHRHCEIVI